MTNTQATILAAIIASPLLISAVEYAYNKVSARLKYRGWQAVNLVNGQWYFGKVSSLSRNDLVLYDIYYLRDDAPTATDSAAGAQTLVTGNEPRLVKLGNELHGPKDRMTITRASILFTEELKDTGSVVKAINEYVGDHGSFYRRHD